MRKFNLFFLSFVFFSFTLKASYQDELLTQLILAEEGDVIEIPEGFHEITVQLSLTVSHVTIRGKGKNKSILSFKNQSSGAEGLYITANNIVLENFSILDTKGDSVKFVNSQNIIMRNLKVGWTGEISESNGGYGFYPVKSENILIESCEAFGASDSGIYVGQSKNIVVRNNYVYQNVSGIEIENSEKADVYGNVAERNTSGILVFSLPGLSRYGSHTRVYNNLIYNNNIRNFSPPSNIVAHVPQGTGLMIMANELVEVFNNKISANDTANILLVSYSMMGRKTDDKSYPSYVKSIYIHGNHLSLGGRSPKGGAAERSREQIEGLKVMIGEPFPHIIYDGFAESEKHDNAQKICIARSQKSTFINLDISHDFEHYSKNIGPYSCELDALAPVVLPLWFDSLTK